MKAKNKFSIAAIFIASFSMVSSFHTEAVEFEVPIAKKEESPKALKLSLPFSYRALQENDRFEFVVQNAVGRLGPDNLQKTLLVTGPLRPCTGIVLFHPKTKKVLLAHQSLVSDLESLKQYREWLETPSDKSEGNTQEKLAHTEIEARLFSVELEPELFSSACQKSGIWLESQRKWISATKATLQKSFNIDPERIRAQIFPLRAQSNDSRILKYRSAERYIAVDSNGEVFTISHTAEDLLGIRKLPQSELLKIETQDETTRYTVQFRRENFRSQMANAWDTPEEDEALLSVLVFSGYEITSRVKKYNALRSGESFLIPFFEVNSND